MSRISDVIKNKNRVEKLRRNRRKDEMTAIKQESAFKARLYDELKNINVLFEDSSIDAVIITIPDIFIAKFSAAIYSADMAEYDIQQVEGKANQFYVRRKFIAF